MRICLVYDCLYPYTIGGAARWYRALAERVPAAGLREEGLRGQPAVLEGEYAGGLTPAPVVEPEPLVVVAGRHIPEKRVPALVPAIAAARDRIPDLRATIFGDGADRGEVLRLIDVHGLGGIVEAPGFVEAERVDRAFRTALCHVLPSEREGYGLLVVEAAAKGTPTDVVAGPDNAATELVDAGQNGSEPPSAWPEAR